MIFSDAEQPWLTHSDKEKMISLIICIFFVMEHQGEEVKGQPGVALAPSGFFGLLRTRSQGGQTVRGQVRRPLLTGTETTVGIA